MIVFIEQSLCISHRYDGLIRNDLLERFDFMRKLKSFVGEVTLKKSMRIELDPCHEPIPLIFMVN